MQTAALPRLVSHASSAAIAASPAFLWARQEVLAEALSAALPAAIMLYNQGELEPARQRLMQFRQLAAGMSEDAKAADADMMDAQHALAQLLRFPQGLDG